MGRLSPGGKPLPGVIYLKTKLEPPSPGQHGRLWKEPTMPLCGRANECGVSYPSHSTGMTLVLYIVPPGGHGPGELGIWVSRCLTFATTEWSL